MLARSGWFRASTNAIKSSGGIMNGRIPWQSGLAMVAREDNMLTLISTDYYSPTGKQIPVERADAKTPDGLPLLQKNLLCIHGISANKKTFNPIVRNLKYPFDAIVTMDLRGRGDSSKPTCAEEYGLKRHAEDAVRVLDAHNIEKTMVLGHSMGGFVAYQMAKYFPDRLTGIVLLDSGFPKKPLAEATNVALDYSFGRLERTFANFGEYLKYVNVSNAPLSEDMIEYYHHDVRLVSRDAITELQKQAQLKLLMRRKGRGSASSRSTTVTTAAAEGTNADGGDDSSNSPIQSKCSLLAVTADRRDIEENNLTELELQKIQQPTVLLCATKGFSNADREPFIPPETAELLARTIPDLKHVVVKGANHYSIAFAEEHAKEVAREVDELAKRIYGYD